jgi:hypothetical protein
MIIRVDSNDDSFKKINLHNNEHNEHNQNFNEKTQTVAGAILTSQADIVPPEDNSALIPKENFVKIKRFFKKISKSFVEFSSVIKTRVLSIRRFTNTKKQKEEHVFVRSHTQIKHLVEKLKEKVLDNPYKKDMTNAFETLQSSQQNKSEQNHKELEQHDIKSLINYFNGNDIDDGLNQLIIFKKAKDKEIASLIRKIGPGLKEPADAAFVDKLLKRLGYVKSEFLIKELISQESNDKISSNESTITSKIISKYYTSVWNECMNDPQVSRTFESTLESISEIVCELPENPDKHHFHNACNEIILNLTKYLQLPKPIKTIHNICAEPLKQDAQNKFVLQLFISKFLNPILSGKHPKFIIEESGIKSRIEICKMLEEWVGDYRDRPYFDDSLIKLAAKLK